VYAELDLALPLDPQARRSRARPRKLFKHVGENNVIWGTDSIWYGSPQDQIQAFRTFQIAPELLDKHGYPTMTPQLCQKVFAYDAAKPYNLSIDEMQKKARTDAVA
jgi:hypothetical protein